MFRLSLYKQKVTENNLLVKIQVRLGVSDFETNKAL